MVNPRRCCLEAHFSSQNPTSCGPSLTPSVRYCYTPVMESSRPCGRVSALIKFVSFRVSKHVAITIEAHSTVILEIISLDEKGNFLTLKGEIDML